MQTELNPFWNEIDRFMSLMTKYHSFEITQSHQNSSESEGSSETRTYQARHVQTLIVASHAEGGLIKAQFVFRNLVPTGWYDLTAPRLEVFWSGRINEGKFTFSDERMSAILTGVLKTQLYIEAIVRVTTARGVSISKESGTPPMRTPVLFKQGKAFYPKLRLDLSISDSEGVLLYVYFFESFLISPTANPPAIMPMRFSHASDFMRFLERELDFPRLSILGAETLNFRSLLRH